MVRCFIRARLALRGPVITGSYADILHVLACDQFPTRRGGIDEHNQRTHIGSIRLGKKHISLTYVQKSRVVWASRSQPLGRTEGDNMSNA